MRESTENKKISVKLPEDIKQYPRRRAYRYVAALVILCVLEVIIFVAFRETFFMRGATSAEINILAAVAVLFFFVFLPYRSGRSWCGRIRKYKVVVKNIHDGPGLNYIETRHRESRIILYLTNGNSSFTKDITQYDPPRGDDQLSRYKEGAVAVYVPGTRYLAVLSEDKHNPSVCVVCGEQSDSHDTVCKHCGHTLLKYSDIYS